MSEGNTDVLPLTCQETKIKNEDIEVEKTEKVHVTKLKQVGWILLLQCILVILM